VKTRNRLDQKKLTWQVVRETVKKFLGIPLSIAAPMAAA
jgi:hypothetical protein